MYKLGLYEKAIDESLPLIAKLQTAKDCGFDFLEMSIDESQEKLSRLYWGEGQKKALKKNMNDSNFYIESICLSAHRKYPLGSVDIKTTKKSIEIAENAIDLADFLNIKLIQLAGYDVYYEESNTQTEDIFFDNLKKIVKYAEKHEIVLAFETMETNFMNTVEKAMKYVKEIDSPSLKIYPDTGNITNSGVDVVNDILCGKGYIVAAHLKETLPKIFRNLQFGAGHVNFADAIKAYKKIGCNKFLAEMWYSGKDWKKNIINANKFLRGYLNEIFNGA